MQPRSTIANCRCQLFRQCAFILTPSVEDGLNKYLVENCASGFLFIGSALEINLSARSISPPQTDLISLFIHAEAEKRPVISIMLIYASLENN
jgi:hypothetical protein